MPCLSREEEWRPVLGMDGVMVSSWGRCQMDRLKYKSVNRFKVIIINGVDHLLCDLVAKAWVPNPDGLPFVGFHNGNPDNCMPDNLFWASEKFFKPNKNTTLSKEQVILIRKMYDAGQSYKSLAYSFNVSVGCIASICTNKSWRF